MGEDRLHVVFGTGQVGHALAAVLAGRGLTVRVVSRHRPPELADGIDWRAADATDPDAASDAAKGAAVVYQCLNAPYTQWPERFPPLQRGVLAATERTGALLVCLENLYGYGPTVATVIELVAAFVLPVVVIAAGHSDWVLPSIVITIGPLLLWLDHLVHIPRYRPVGWALIVGPIILVATMSGSALAVTTGLAAGVVLLGTATAGFHDLAGIRPARAEPGSARRPDDHASG